MYEFECKTHGYFTLVRSVADRDKGVCPECGKTGTRVFTRGVSNDVLGPSSYEQINQILLAATAPWEHVPKAGDEIRTRGDLRKYLRQQGFSEDAVISRDEFDRRTGLVSPMEERFGRRGREIERPYMKR